MPGGEKDEPPGHGAAVGAKCMDPALADVQEVAHHRVDPPRTVRQPYRAVLDVERRRERAVNVRAGPSPPAPRRTRTGRTARWSLTQGATNRGDVTGGRSAAAAGRKRALISGASARNVMDRSWRASGSRHSEPESPGSSSTMSSGDDPLGRGPSRGRRSEDISTPAPMPQNALDPRAPPEQADAHAQHEHHEADRTTCQTHSLMPSGQLITVTATMRSAMGHGLRRLPLDPRGALGKPVFVGLR